LTNLKAKVLKSRLQSKMRDPKRCPFVEPLVFLSAEQLEVRLKEEGRVGVVTRKDFLRAVQHHEFPGASPSWRAERIPRDVMSDVGQALAAIGIRPRKGRAMVGSYVLGEVLSEGIGYQDRAAEHRDRKSLKTRARVYLVPQQASVEKRQQLRRAADREATLLWDLREHPNILRIADYVTDAPLGPTVLFDDFAGGLPLDVFLRHDPAVSFEERVSIVEQIGRALGFCHRKSTIHGGLAPSAVLVRRNPETNAVETRLLNFQLGQGREAEVTQHWSQLAQEGWAIYQAPELRENPTARSTQSDVFSLGALAYLIFTGRAPGERVEDVDRRLATERQLDPRSVANGMHPEVAEAVCLATSVSPIQRVDDVSEWLEYLLDVATAPTSRATANEADPLEAGKGVVVGADLEVLGLLGVGSTARVLKVKRGKDDRQYALKIALDETHAPRLLDEVDVLKKLPKHPRIVDLHDTPKLGGRTCLLLSLAGEKTLQRKLRELGPVSLEEASRYGDDLLLALEHLEDHQTLHRDIKPANLGVGSISNKADHLTLFDFSLSRLPPTELQVGTAVYRDPYLRARGVWDFAADRWSAAITLHEMIAGTRPTFSTGIALDPTGEITIATERFDATVRDGLVQFFTKALAREVGQRHKSANEMRHEWVTVVGAPARAPKASHKPAAAPPPTEADAPELTDEDVAKLGADTPVAVLPLSVRARNALDRAGLTRAEELLGLSSNRLSAIRGVGHLVAREILEFRDRWKGLQKAVEPAATPFFPSYAGEDLLVGTTSLGGNVATALTDGGLPTLRAVAEAPSDAVSRLMARAGADASAVRALLVAENGRANQREKPTTLEGWIDALLPAKKGKKSLVRALYGLDAPFAGRIDVTVGELSRREQKTQAAVYIATSKAREDWSKHGALRELRDMLRDRVDAASGAASLASLADELGAAMPHAADAAQEVLRVQAAALFRIVSEVEKEDAGGLRLVRLRDAAPWLFLSDEHARVTRALGEAADVLAARPSLAATGEARRVLAEVVSGTKLVALKEERLFELAARASKTAACSARLEIYPRGLVPARAVELCVATFKGGVNEEQVRARVSARYPEALPLPSRPELDALLAPLGFAYVQNPKEGFRYERAGEAQHTSLLTAHGTASSRAPTALPTQARSMEVEAIDARQFDEKLKHAVEMRAFRVVGVKADRAREAALALSSRIEARTMAFDEELWKEVKIQMDRAGIKSDDVVFTADRQGPRGEHWPRLLKLVHAAADALADRLAQATPQDGPLLLVQPGPIARYELMDFLKRLVDLGKNQDAPAVFLLVPAHDTGGVPRINETLVIPGVLPSNALWVSQAWLANRHNAAA
jgi:serine/threonine protein kinase